MAANDEFPRGVNLGATATGVNSSVTITLPAIAALAWILTDLKISAVNLNAPNTGNAGGVTLNGIAVPAAVGFSNGTGFGDVQVDSWQGKIPLAPNTAAVVTFSLNGDATLFLDIGAYAV